MLFRSGGITLECKNPSNKETTTGEWYCIQRYENNVWNTMAYVSGEDIAWKEMAVIITEKNPLKIEIDWKWLYGELGNGKYRIVKEFFIEEDSYLQYAEFDIE